MQTVPEFYSLICSKFGDFRGIVDNHDRVVAISEMLFVVSLDGRHNARKIFDKFSAQNDPDKCRDLLFEMWVYFMLKQNPNVKSLEYEPEDCQCPPDFRFQIDDVHFDLQVKRIHNVINEITKRLFERECSRRLGNFPNPWFINIRLSKQINRQDINIFFEYLRKNMSRFKPSALVESMLHADDYSWPPENPRVSFSFCEKNHKSIGIQLGTIVHAEIGSSMAEWVRVEPIRKAFERAAKDASRSLKNQASETQSNIVLVQASSEITIEDDLVLDALYGDEQVSFVPIGLGASHPKTSRDRNGLFGRPHPSNITGVIYVPQSVSPIDPHFRGNFMPHPKHLNEIQHHAKPFNEMTFTILPQWKKQEIEYTHA